MNAPPGGEVGSTKHALNGHTYCCMLNGDVCAATGEPTADSSDACLKFHRARLGQRSDDAKRLGIPYFISEFGACMDSDECVREIEQVADTCDEHGISGWAYWQYKTYKDLTTSAGTRSEGFFNNDGSLQNKKVKALARTYVMAAQGTVKDVVFNSKNGVFVTNIKIDSSITEPTLLHVFETSVSGGDVWYPNGFDLQLMVGNTDVSDQVELMKNVGANRVALKASDKLHG